jgi:hypothetical protein
MNRTCGLCAVAVMVVAIVAAPGPWASAWAAEEDAPQGPPDSAFVLLDEYWSPEIVQEGTQVTEIDVQETGDVSQAMAGEFSVLLEKPGGRMGVRFRNAAGLRWLGLLPDDTEGRLWYRTDHWDGRLSMGIWVYVHSVGRPVEVLVAELDGGGEQGRLIADNQWHQARGRLLKGADFDVAAPGKYMDACYVWIRATGGPGVEHKTYIDRIEAAIVDGPRKGKKMPPPIRRVRPEPGKQLDAPGLILWEGENAIEHTFTPGGLYVPNHADQQGLLSNGAWLHELAAEGKTVAWEIRAPRPGKYTLWARGFWYEGAFRWRIGKGKWQTSGPDRKISNAVKYIDSDADAWGVSALMIGWTCLGEVYVSSGTNRLEVQCLDGAVGHAFDCWALAKGPFAPTGQ